MDDMDTATQENAVAKKMTEVPAKCTWWDDLALRSAPHGYERGASGDSQFSHTRYPYAPMM